MRTAAKMLGGKGTARIRRRVLAVAATTAMIGGATVLTAPSAFADNYYQENCSQYHSWTECVSYDIETATLSVTAFNGYSYAQAEALWLKVATSQVGNEGFEIPAGAWRGYGIPFAGLGTFTACAGIDNIQIVCGNFLT